MRSIFLVAIIYISNFQFAISQCTECPSGATVVTGSASINEQNNTTDYCIMGTWTGTISNIANNSTVTLCPSATWELPGNLLLQQNVVIDNYGTITDNGAGNEIFIQGSVELNNKPSGTINVMDFENQDTDFNNEGILTAENIYLHGPSTNSGTINSTADCSGNANTSCGFFIGNKGTPFNNTGTLNVVDGNLGDQVIGGTGIINSTGTLEITNNGGQTDNVFNVNNLNLQASQTVSTGTFEISGVLNCNNANITTDMCLTPTGSLGFSCTGSTNIMACSILPVTIVDFDVKTSGDKLLFTWEVMSEFNLSHYEIMSSTDGQEYVMLTTLEANNDGFYQASYIDRVKSIKYFKLKSVDLDGTQAYYSDVRRIDNRADDFYEIMPNPVSLNDNIRINFNDDQNALISIYSMDGQKIKSLHFQNQSSIDLPLQEIQKSGLYIIKILTENQVYTDEIYIR